MEKSKLARMQELVEILNKAGKAYYQDAEEIMSNYEYDRLYDELLDLEKELGTTLSNSPTVNVGYEVLSELPKERHERPMLSLDKTKDVAELEAFIGEQEALMSWKMDGLTIVLTYREGAPLQSRDQRKRRSGRSGDGQCPGVPQYSPEDPLSGRVDPPGRGGDRLPGF